MTDTLVDTSVIIDIATSGSAWQPWSAARMAQAGDDGALVVNPVIFAELAVRYATNEALDNIYPPSRFRREGIPWEAAFLAGHAFLRYRRRGGSRRAPLPDFFIGAHAAVRGYRLLTRDRGYYREYFPTLVIVSPETDA